MKQLILKRFFVLTMGLLLGTHTFAQVTERERPKAWDELVPGARFRDRFQPISPVGSKTDDSWGADCVRPRYPQNGIEDPQWSYWGGNILFENGQYHLFVCRWAENSAKGHMEWPNSIVVHAVCDRPEGPFKVKDIIGKGHNPEAFRTKDGRYVVYVIDGCYLSDGVDGPWTFSHFEFDPRDRNIIEGLSNLSFARREDGSYVMVCRGGGIWFSRDGLSEYAQVTQKSVYPPVDGHFEDPVIWRDNVQYNLIVNDWYGRIAYYLRSKDGIHWKVEQGEAYTPGIAVYSDGTHEDWFKYERIKVLQDEYGRAYQANFAVIDTLKHFDLPNDRHSSKNLTIPMNRGLLLTVLNTKAIDAKTAAIEVKIAAEPGFDPQTDVDVQSLHFGSSDEVNFGRGARAAKTRKAGKDLVVTFAGAGNGLTADDFAAKLIGRKRTGELLYGYSRLPGVNYLEPALSACLPRLVANSSPSTLSVDVQNFGQVASAEAHIRIVDAANEAVELASGIVGALEPFGKTTVELPVRAAVEKGKMVRVMITSNGKVPETLTGAIK